VANAYFNENELFEFDEAYKTEYEANALYARGLFLETFPRDSLQQLTLNDYVIGLKRPTFCTFVEVTTRYWARITGATAFKFGIYFGRTKSDPKKMYRFATKFGESGASAFSRIKESLLSLIEEGSKQNPNFEAIDNNPLSPMFKAKILSLYFPSKFINICSNEHLLELASIFELPEDLYLSQTQHELLSFKKENSITRGWSYPKYMTFLYHKYMNKELIKAKKQPKKINFKALQERKDARGKAAEGFAFEWEKKRLKGSDLGHLINRIEDRTSRPGYGYDFLSYNQDETERYIEVKSVLKINEEGTHRFFVSKTERQVSESADHKLTYYLYLVFFDDRGRPIDLYHVRAQEFYRRANIDADTFVVQFQDERQ
jgi:hypothetical protein